MNNIKLVVLGVFFFLLAKNAFAEVLYSEDFDSYSPWSMNDEDPGNPYPCPGSYACVADESSTHGTPDIEISTAVARSGMGFRVYNWRDSHSTQNDNGLINATLWPAQKDFYIRWYARYNYNSMEGYKKYFRIRQADGTQRFIIDLRESSSYGGKTRWLFWSAAGGGTATSNENWHLEDDYTINTWICVEIFIDQTNDAWTLWIDGVQQGSPVSFEASDFDMTGLHIGGNYTGEAGVDHITDYDDIVVSTTYVGPITAPPDAPVLMNLAPSGSLSCE